MYLQNTLSIIFDNSEYNNTYNCSVIKEIDRLLFSINLLYVRKKKQFI